MLKKLLLVSTIMGSSLAYAGEKSAQLSILPGLSFGATKNDSISKFSFNILGATNKNVTGLDISLVGLRTVEGDFVGRHLSLIPIEKFTVTGDLYGGSFSLWNDVNGKVNGSVFGLINTVNDVNGSSAGLVNLVDGDAISAFGLFNKVEGSAVSAGGLVNLVDGDVKSSFGLFNKIEGGAVTTTGLVTIVNGHVNNQFGLFNRAESVKGVQFGLINSTRNLDGVQIGLVNHATNGVLPVLPLVNFRKTF